jgi:hypothetical protein
MIVQLTDEEVEAALNKARADKEYSRVVLTPRPVPAELEPEGLLSAAKLARTIGVSVPTIGRFVDEGMPVEMVGNRRKFDLAASRGWLKLRGKRPTKAKPATTDNIDVTSITTRTGLREVG